MGFESVWRSLKYGISIYSGFWRSVVGMCEPLLAIYKSSE